MPKTRILGRLFSNMGYKFAALGLATLVWYIVQGEEILEVNAKIDVKVEVAFGYAVRDMNIVSRDVTLRGPRALVGTMQGKPILAIIRVPPDKTGNLRYRLDKEFIPRWDNRIKITIHDPYINIVVEEKMTKRLPVRPMLLGEVDPLLMVEESKATPDEIEVSGAKSDIQKLTEIGTEPIDISGLKETKSFASSIARANLPDINFGVKDISVLVQLGPKKLSKDFQVVPIEIINSDKVSSAKPASVAITVSAPQDQVEKVSAKVLRAFVDVAGKGPGRYEAPVTATAPDGVTIQLITPKVVTVEIYNQRKLK
jgi:YbbR domain-containing protein